MRPLRLELSGFTCFRDLTIIDFSNLELFAIVGQTGAGKSSILDAITFALFEQTPRLGSKPAKELISQGSSGMSLALEFEASDGRKYRVARTYSLKSSEVRFERLEDDKWVTAVEQVKKKELAEAIERTVGLDFEGFTRAVLLPQGEFDRFLRGEPKQRRDLLKNLIGLERIEAMQKRSGALAREAKTKSEAMQIQLEGLLGATPEALEALGATQVQQEALLLSTSTALEKARAVLLEAHEITRLETALQSTQLEVQRLSALDLEIQGVKDQIVQARRVAQVMPLLENVWRLETRVLQLEQEVMACQQQYTLALETQAKHQIALEEARDAALQTSQLEAQASHLTGLVPRLERLHSLGGTLAGNANLADSPWSELAWSELERLAAELPLLERSTKQLRELERRKSELGQVANRLLEAQTALLEQAELLEVTQAQLSQDAAQLETAKIAAEQIPNVESELRTLEALRPKLQRLAELNGSLDQAKINAPVFTESAWTRLETISSQLKTHAKYIKQEETLKAQHQTAQNDLLHWENQLSESQQTLETMKTEGQAAAATQKQLELNLEAAKRENMAVELTRGLSLGDPCPVCQMPLKKLLDNTDSRVPEIQIEIEQSQLKVQQLREEFTRLRIAEKGHLSSKIQAQDNLMRIEKEQQQTSLERQQLEQHWDGIITDFNDPKSALQEARAGLLAGFAFELTQAGASDLATRVKQLQDQKTELEQTERRRNQQYNQTNTLLASIKSRLEAAKALVDSRQIEQKNALQEGLRLEQQRLDFETERKTYLAKLEAVLGTKAQPGAALEQAQQKLLNGFATQLRQAGASNNLESQIQALKNKRQQLEQHAETARETLSHSKTNSASLKSALETKQHNLNSLQTETSAAREDSSQQLSQLGFTNHQTAQAMALPETQIIQLEQTVQQHTQNQLLNQQRQNEILQELRGRSLEQPLLVLQTQTQQLEQQNQELHHSLGQLQSQKNQLTQQIGQAKTLRREQNTLEKRFDTYAALAQDLRGNEFQDYLLEGVQQQLLLRATKTMQGITRERYTLELIESEFHVRDAWNGSEARGVKTLSGGESFIASLSLALSLSDYLAGNQALGALFLDEGFGTLDADALEMVANTLENLQTQGRMVGVITHVPALAERLPMRLMIEKAQDTSRVHWDG